MKTAACIQMLGVMALMFGSYRTSAQFVFLTDNRSVTVSGTTNGFPEYGETTSPSLPFVPFDNSVSGGGGGVFSSASQGSFLNANAIGLTNRISAGYDFSVPGHASTGSGKAAETFEITFKLTTPTLVTLTGEESDNALITVPQAYFSGPGVFTMAPLFGNAWYFSGILQPGTCGINADASIEYDAFGDEFDNGSVTTIINLTAIAYPEITAVSMTNNTLQLSGTSVAGSTNRVLATTNLALPMSQWRVISTNVADTNGVVQFTGSIVPGQSAQFYRISFP